LKLLLEGDNRENGTDEEIGAIHVLEFESVLVICEGEYLCILVYEMMHCTGMSGGTIPVF
jgi:hypothetical protein